MISLERAIQNAIECVELVRRQKYAAGDAAYRQGLRKDEIQSKGVTGTGFEWAENDHKKYVELTETVRQLRDIIEILSDPGVTVENQEQE